MDNIIMLKCDWIRGEAREGVCVCVWYTQGLFSAKTPFISSSPLSLSLTHSLLSWILNEPCCGRLQTEAVGILKHWYRIRNTLPPFTNKSRGCWAFQGWQTLESFERNSCSELMWVSRLETTPNFWFSVRKRGERPVPPWYHPPHWKIRFKQSLLTMSWWHWVMPHFQIFSCMKCQKLRLETFSRVSGKCHVLLNQQSKLKDFSFSNVKWKRCSHFGKNSLRRSWR